MKTEDEREEEGALVLKKCAQGVDEGRREIFGCDLTSV